MRYPPLLITIFLVFTLKPFADQLRSFTVQGGFLLLLVLLAVLYAFRYTGALAVWLAILGGSAVTLRFVADYQKTPTLLMVSHGLGFILMLLVMIAILSKVLRARTVNSDLVVGAMCLYLVIGMAWAFLYYWIYLLSPGSFFASPPASLAASANEARFTQMLYLSFSALTTIGSSGEEPLTTMSRQLAVVESAMGQLYLAVLISRLVGFSTSSPANT